MLYIKKDGINFGHDTSGFRERNKSKVNKVKLYDLISASAAGGLTMQKPDGSMPAGHNGPWQHRETPARTTAHWALLFLKAFFLEGKSIYRDAALKSCAFLMSEKIVHNGYFHCREHPRKDKINNLIGQTWVIEALAIVGNCLEEERLISFAHQVIKKHHFDEKYFLWHKAHAKGDGFHLCRTLNQQILFAAMALFVGRTMGDRELADFARAFFNNVLSMSRFIRPGLPHHKVFLPVKFSSFDIPYFKTLIKQWIEKSYWKEISAAYLPFILYGFALAHYLNPGDPTWDNDELKQWLKSIIRFVTKSFPYRYRESPDSYMWSYNPVGFEVYFALNEFRELLGLDSDPDLDRGWVELQIKGYYDFKSNLLNKNTSDPAVLMARMYEAVWLPDLELEIEV